MLDNLLPEVTHAGPLAATASTASTNLPAGPGSFVSSPILGALGELHRNRHFTWATQPEVVGNSRRARFGYAGSALEIPEETPTAAQPGEEIPPPREIAGHGTTRDITAPSSTQPAAPTTLAPVVLTDSLDWQSVVAVARGARIELSADARERIVDSRLVVDSIVGKDDPVYGLNTGVGALSEVVVPPEMRRRQSRNIVMSHAAGVGKSLGKLLGATETRAIMAAAINNFARGWSGIRIEVVERLIALLNAEKYRNAAPSAI
ncbi:MAG: aromatic amino acid lyase [Burkholderiaceae bacterium]